MKIRTSFVTNSSSSSFIISDKNDNMTKEIVYGMVRSFYEEGLTNLKNFIEICGQFNLTFNKENGYFKFTKDISFDKECQIRDLVESQYGVSIWGAQPINLDWIDCKTYKEYEEYWKNKYSEIEKGGVDSHRVFAPFSIVDIKNDKEYLPLHYGSHAQVEKAPFKELVEDLYYWYLEDMEDMNEEEIINEFVETTGIEDKEEIKRIVDICKSENIVESNIVPILLGNICVCSECGYMTDNVVKKLGEISKYWCNHMG